MTILRMGISCWIPKATNTHTRTTCTMWLHERASVLRLTHIVCRVCVLITTNVLSVPPPLIIWQIWILYSLSSVLTRNRSRTWCWAPVPSFGSSRSFATVSCFPLQRQLTVPWSTWCSGTWNSSIAIRNCVSVRSPLRCCDCPPVV